MVSMTVRKADGSEGQALELSDAVFAAEPNVHCVRAAVAQFLANQRQGTHSTKMRGDVRGGGRKPWKQKGTGRARQGSTRSPQWRGGAIIFGPHPRDYSYRINRKVRQSAYRSIFSDLRANGKLVVLESFGLEAPRTRAMADLLARIGVANGPVLVLSDGQDVNMLLSARNLPWVKAVAEENLNVYDLLTHDWVVATAETLKRIEEQYA